MGTFAFEGWMLSDQKQAWTWSESTTTVEHAGPIENLYVMGGSVTFSPGGTITNPSKPAPRLSLVEPCETLREGLDDDPFGLNDGPVRRAFLGLAAIVAWALGCWWLAAQAG